MSELKLRVLNLPPNCIKLLTQSILMSTVVSFFVVLVLVIRKGLSFVARPSTSIATSLFELKVMLFNYSIACLSE